MTAACLSTSASESSSTPFPLTGLCENFRTRAAGAKVDFRRTGIPARATDSVVCSEDLPHQYSLMPSVFRACVHHQPIAEYTREGKVVRLGKSSSSR